MQSLIHLLQKQKDIVGDFLIRMESDKYGVEEFTYSSYDEMLEGFERLKESVQENRANDGIDRDLTMGAFLGGYDTQEDDWGEEDAEEDN
jgi:hypothetical protein